MISYEIINERYSVVVALKMTDVNDHVSEFRETFLNPIDAQKWVAVKLEYYLRKRISNYIIHSSMISRHSQHAYYHTAEYRKSMQELMRYLNVINDQKLHQLANYVNNNASFLEKILPAQGNPSYNSSKEILRSITNLAGKLQKRENRVF
ncbi:MAG TPA: hypothetical protein PKH58_01475 [Paludibacteraceae bacterium]|nr:hypothetical protein [Paludibacteraceae bacterium]